MLVTRYSVLVGLVADSTRLKLSNRARVRSPLSPFKEGERLPLGPFRGKVEGSPLPLPQSPGHRQLKHAQPRQKLSFHLGQAVQQRFR